MPYCWNFLHFKIWDTWNIPNITAIESISEAIAGLDGALMAPPYRPVNRSQGGLKAIGGALHAHNIRLKVESLVGPQFDPYQ
jgi:hypothetical protein